jgi:hypothetical protein
MPTGIWELRHSLTDLDAAIAQHPCRTVDGWITFSREQVSPGFVRYHLSQDELGDRLGTIELRGNEERVEMRIDAPAFLPTHDVTDEELAGVKACADPDERRKKLLEVLSKLDDEHRELARRRKEHFENVTSGLIEYLNRDWILSAPTGAQAQWHLGKTLLDTPTSGSLIQLPGGELIQAKKVTSLEAAPPATDATLTKRPIPLSGKQAWEQYEEDVEDAKLARAEERLQKHLHLAAAELEIAQKEKQAQDATQARATVSTNWQLPPEEPDMIGKPGNPGLPHKELIERLAKAQQGKEIKERDSQKTWKQIAKEIGWKYGDGASGIKLLEDARHRLKRANENTLQEVQEWRKRKEKN